MPADLAPDGSALQARNALVVGFGSIGRRHADVLSGLGCPVAVVSRRPVAGRPAYDDLSRALADWQPDYVVVATKTSEHYETLTALAANDFEGRVLVEKPLFDRPASLPRHRFSRAAVAYNLRFHPLVRKLTTLLNGARLVTGNIYMGSYLPLWRPGTDYRESYSAKKNEGGGVLRDLSHELDYAQLLFGQWRRLTAAGGHVSSLEIDSDDAYTLLMETDRCPVVSIHVSYLDRLPQRSILVTTDSNTIRVDLIANTIAIDGVPEESVVVEPNDTYRAEHRAMLGADGAGLCTLEEGLATVATIDAAERAAGSAAWIAR